MLLLVNLFSDSSVLSDFARYSKQITKRQFSLAKDLTPVQDICSNKEFIDKINKLSTQRREYAQIGDSFSDNLFPLELLGVGKDCREYTVVIDLSDSLDYILHLLTHCDIKKVRSMPNYSEVSSHIMNLEYEKLGNLKFGSLLSLDEKLVEYVQTLVATASEKCNVERAVIEETVFLFYKNVSEMASRVKEYCILYLKEQYEKGTIVYRSKSYSAVVATSIIPIDLELQLHYDSYSDYSLKVKSYKVYEYARQVK